MAFIGWPAGAVEFYEGLEGDNTKAYWQAHRPQYDELVLKPMEELVETLVPAYGSAKIFRPYRDTRFSADKSPYKTNIAAALERGGYISFSADGLGVGSGYYMMAADQLERFRAAIAAERTGKELEKVAAAIRAAGIEVTAHESLKNAPRGYPKDHPRVELLRMKGAIVWKHWPPAGWMRTGKARDRVVEVLEAAAPLNRWLDRHVGPTTQPGTGR
jgi:uncharacterized protein (TIGR02453 family)